MHVFFNTIFNLRIGLFSYVNLLMACIFLSLCGQMMEDIDYQNSRDSFKLYYHLVHYFGYRPQEDFCGTSVASAIFKQPALFSPSLFFVATSQE